MKTTTVSSQLIDERVILTMIACSLIALIIVGFRYINDKPDFPVSISLNEGTLYTDQSVKFIAKGQDISSASLVWDFGDNSDKHDKGITAFHKFSARGRYDITLTINGKRREYKTIYITEAPKPVDPNQVEFICPDKAIVGEPVSFKDFTHDAVKWEWWFGERGTATPEANGQEVKYTFKEIGLKTVTLVINEKIIGTRKILIEPKPIVKTGTQPSGSGGHKDLPPISFDPIGPPLPNGRGDTTATIKTPDNKPSAPKAPDITKEQMAKQLKAVIDGQINASDFSKYMNSNQKVTVYLNGTGMTFETLCEKLRDIKRSRRLRSLEVTRLEKDENNFIKSMNVNFDKKFITL